ncbi:MAG: hypothetical protein FJ038_11925 [Chloroflexi bacterium]|nr:hypothetical protein [Chloroflexota bacterium]
MFEVLRGRPIGVADDELSALGVVLVVGQVAGRGTRVLAAHYVRPVARDAHGHVQRLSPAVLTTFDAESDTFEQFGWGIVPELAFRVGRRAGDYELEHERRTGFLVGLTHASITARAEVRRAIAAYAVAPAAVTS